jgi:hypothetical protein
MNTMYSFKMKKAPADAYSDLRELLPQGSKVYVIQRHVSRSGMTRYLSLYIINEDGAFQQITGLVAALKGVRVYEWAGTHFALRVQGAGMDMHFHEVYGLSRRLHGGDGYALKAVTL